MMAEKKSFPKLESVQRISKIPVVETGVHLATGIYDKIKNSNPLTRWYLCTIEGGVALMIDTSLIAVPLFEVPMSVVDTIVCKGLDTVQQKIPAINYPPEEVVNKTKDYVSTKIVQPVLKRAESVKEFSVNGATKYGELAASRIDTALDVADQYVEKYLPDANDVSETKAPHGNGESKAIQTIEHVNRFSRKLQRRLTNRTIAEAKALRKQGVNTVQILMKLAELAIKDPSEFRAKMKALWIHLSQEEPENQLPPANLEQLIAMITRETARRFVHLTNFAVTNSLKLPSYTVQKVQVLVHHADIVLDQMLKTVHLERTKTIIVRNIQSHLHNLNLTLRDIQLLMENLVSGLLTKHQQPTTQERPIPLHTLSPVAQSPERTPEISKPEPQSPKISPENKKDLQEKPKTPKKEKKAKMPTTSQAPTTLESKPSQSAEVSNNPPPALNGDAMKNAE